MGRTTGRSAWITTGMLGAGLWATAAGATPIPDRVWGTYAHSFNNLNVRVAADAAGNVYIASGTSLAGLATTGAHKEDPQGNIDVHLTKLDPAGDLIWATYFGGADYEIVRAIAVEGDMIVFTGATYSATGIASPGSFQPIKGAPEISGFAAAFTTAGVWQWGTYLDGALPYDIAIGPLGVADVVGSVVGEADIATPGAYQTGPSGEEDAFLIRLGTQGERLWGTYYGGTAEDGAEGVAHDALGGVYVVGTTRSLGSIATVGAYQETNAGSRDMFVARFIAGGVLDRSTYFGGTHSDYAHAVAFHPDGGVAVVGKTFSPGIATPGSHQEVLGGGDDLFLVRFDAAGSLVWSTYLGGSGSDRGRSVMVDPLGFIYAAGDTSSATGIATPNAWQTINQSSLDALLGKFDDTGNLLWGTYYGGPKGELSYSAALAGPGRVVLGGQTLSEAGIASPDAYLPGPPRSFVAVLTDVAANACSMPRDCGGGPCVDGFCCDSACGGGADDCQACSKAAGGLLDGHCSPSAPGKPCRDAFGVCDAAEACAANLRECPADADLPDDTPCPDGLCLAGLCAPPPEASTSTTVDTTGDLTTAAASSSDGTVENLTDGTGSTASDSAAEAGSTTADASSGDLSAGTGSTSASDSGVEATGTTPSDPPSSTSADLPTSSTAPDDAPTSSPATSGDTSSGPSIDDPPDLGCACDVRHAAPVSLLFTTPLLFRRRRSTT